MRSPRRTRGLKPNSIQRDLRGPEGPLFHGGTVAHGYAGAQGYAVAPGDAVASSRLLPVEIDEEVGGFVDADAVETGFLEFGFQALPDGDCEIFGGRNLGEEFGNFFVQEAVVHGIEDFAVHHFLELLEIDDEAGTGIDFSLYRDFEGVVVAVAVGVVAFAEDAAVLVRREVRIVVVVRGGEFGFAREIDHKKSG